MVPKVGDSVVCTDTSTEYFRVGDVYEVLCSEGGIIYINDCEGDRWYWIDRADSFSRNALFKLYEPEDAKVPTGFSNDYYKLPPEAVELQDLIEHLGMDFSIGNIFKAAWRCGRKPGVDAKYDLEKIIWFAQRKLDQIQGEN